MMDSHIPSRTNVGHVVRYREPLPPGCPPEAAECIDSPLIVFRLVKADPPTEQDFRSQRAEKPTSRFSGVSECQARGLSVFTRNEDGRRALKLPNLRGRLLCSVDLSAGAGKIQQTGAPSHHTWWPLAHFNILGRCRVQTP